MDKKNRYPLMYAFMIGMFILMAISVFNMYQMPDKGVSKMYFFDVNDTWMDFFNPIFHAGGRDPYFDTTRIYPPICYCFYWFIARFIPEPIYSVAPKSMRFSQPIQPSNPIRKTASRRVRNCVSRTAKPNWLPCNLLRRKRKSSSTTTVCCL